jgi:hypothetical protein
MNSLEGKIEVKIYDKNNNLKRVVQGKNSVTNAGIKRLCEILTQGIRNGLTETERLTNVPLNTLPNGQNSIGVNVVEWKDKEKSTFDFSENIMGLNESAVMFQENNSGDYSIVTKGDLATSTNFYYPNKDGKNDKNTSGWVCDLGLKHIYKKEFMFSQNPVYLCDDYGVGYTNVKYNSLKIIDKKGYTLESGVDYEVLSWGDYNSSPELYFLKDKYLNVSLFLTYSYFNVPNIPIIGFSFDCVNEANAQEAAKNLIAGWSWSLNQGKSKLPHLFGNSKTFYRVISIVLG